MCIRDSNQVDRKVVPFIRDNPKLDLVRSPGAVHWTFICAADKEPVSYTHLRAHETVLDLVCRLLLEKKKINTNKYNIVQSIN